MRKIFGFISAVAALLSVSCLNAGEFEVADVLRVNGYMVAQSSAEVNGNKFSVGGSTLAAQYGKIGIGTSTPSFLLHVSSAAGVGGDLVVISTGSSDVIRMTGAGEIYANKFIGDGSGLSGITAGDNLGDHTATQALRMGSYGVNTSSHVSAAAYQINGSTIAAVLKGNGSLAYGVNAGTSNVTGGDHNVFIGNSAGASNTTGTSGTFIGYMAGYSNGDGYGNVYVGDKAGYLGKDYNEYNTFVGYYAGYKNNDGAQNTFLGGEAGYGNITGNGNTLIGYDAGYVNVTGENNAYVGHDSGYYNKGSANAVLGSMAGDGSFGSNYSSSTIVGDSAGQALTSGGDNIFIGYKAGYSVTSGTGNVVIGYNKDTSAPGANNELNIGGVLFGKLDARTVGISTRAPQAALDIVSTGTAANVYAQIWRNGSGVIVASMTSEGALYPQQGDNLGDHTAISQLKMGDYAIYSSSDITAARYQINGSTVLAILPGLRSLAVGLTSGKVNTADDNSFLGYMTGQNNTDGGGNSFIGSMAGYSSISSSSNTFVGAYAGRNTSLGKNNVYLGYEAGYSGGVATQNVFVGSMAGRYNTGSYGSFVGYRAGHLTTSGDRNTFVGFESGYANTTGRDNVALGYHSYSHTAAGSANVAVGADAGGAGAGSNSFSSSTLVGYRAGYNLQNTSADNIFIGYQAGYSVTFGTGNIVLGYNIGPSGATANNEINIGGVYKGSVSDGTATIPKLTVQAADSGITLTSADMGKTITVNSASAQTVTLPSVTAADIGATIAIVKLGAGKLTIQAAASTYIADSSAAGTLYNNAATPPYASVKLVLVSPNRWMLVAGYGSWITT